MIAKHDYKILDDRVIAGYSLGQIVLPRITWMASASPCLTYSISGELFGHDYRRQLPYHQLIKNTCNFIFTHLQHMTILLEASLDQ
jgi:hypothetical protein